MNEKNLHEQLCLNFIILYFYGSHGTLVDGNYFLLHLLVMLVTYDLTLCSVMTTVDESATAVTVDKFVLFSVKRI